MFLKRAVAGLILSECREDTEVAGKGWYLLPGNELTGIVVSMCPRRAYKHGCF